MTTMSVAGQKPKLLPVCSPSVLPPRWDAFLHARQDRFVPKAEVATAPIQMISIRPVREETAGFRQRAISL